MFLFEQLKKIRFKILAPFILYVQQIEKRLESIQVNLEKQSQRLENIQRTLGRVESRQLNEHDNNKLVDYEFQVFSQWGEDGIIQFLIRNLNIDKKIFIEFGVEDYTQANTRFLLVNNNWSGLVIDGSEANILKVKSDEIYWNFNLKAVRAFITKDNINEIIVQNGIKGEIGILSIDIDGNDYWVWQAINVIDPTIVIIEYNHRFERDLSVTIPYDENFVRSTFHHSMIYFGASLKALCRLANSKGYAFVGCNSNGVNAFFVKKDRKPDCIRELSLEEGIFDGKFCEVRDRNGIQVKTSPEEEKDLLKNLRLPIVNIDD